MKGFFDFGAEFARAAAQFDETAEQGANGQAGIYLGLAHHFGKTAQTGEVLLHGAQGGGAFFVDVGINVGLSEELFVSLL